MRHFFLLMICLMTILPVYAQDFATNTPQPTPSPPDVTHVIVISIDGARPDAILQANTPVMQDLAETGIVDWQAQTVFQPVTIPAHTSLLTGLDPSEHRIIHNRFTTLRIEPPTFISLAQADGYRTAIIAGKEKFLTFHQDEDTYYEFIRTGDPGVTDKTIEILNEGYEVLFVHLPNTDFFGHSTGWMSDTYIYELSNTDANIGRIIEALEELEIRETTLLIITADHGGHDKVHGLNIPEDMTIPMIVNGTGIHDDILLENASITHVARTVLNALDVVPASAMHPSLFDEIEDESQD